MRIESIHTDRERFMELLLIADPSEEIFENGIQCMELLILERLLA